MMFGANDHSFILAHWHEWEIRGSYRQVVLCVETGLELDPSREGFDRADLDQLMHEASAMMTSSSSPIDFIRIVQAEA